MPTALIAAERDKVVPARRSAPLRAAIKNLVFERDIDSGHNDIYDHPAFAAAMREALTRIEAARAGALGRPRVGAKSRRRRQSVCQAYSTVSAAHWGRPVVSLWL